MATWETVGGVLGELLGTVQAPPTRMPAVWISGRLVAYVHERTSILSGKREPLSVRATCSLGQVSHRRITRGAALLRLAKMPVWIS